VVGGRSLTGRCARLGGDRARCPGWRSAIGTAASRRVDYGTMGDDVPMRLVRYSHSCVRLEFEGVVVVVDPGEWSEPVGLDYA